MFNRTNALILVIAIVGAALGFLAGGWIRPMHSPAQRESPQALKIGDAVPDSTLPGLDGKPRSLAEWRGKLVLVNFWASWCAPCREEMPLLDATQKRLAAKGLQIVGIANDSAAATKEFLAKTAVAYPILIDDPEQGDLSERFGNSRDVLPYTVLIGRDGRIVARRPGNFSQSALDAWLAPHL
jgi:peroxiredoxin